MNKKFYFNITISEKVELISKLYNYILNKLAAKIKKKKLKN